ncbi:MAG: tyrosine-type recombinase/integrase [Prevotella sp.]|jgi:site-specific recombinase XerD|nr:tyrosine-type recombinase/integrase [Oribacterium sp.]MEE3385862.1 tyrosine-type recombinase/integrase [Prevotella sp.]
MNQNNTELYQQHLDILSFRDLSPDTIANYASYLNEYIGWTEETISGKDLHAVEWSEVRTYLTHLKKDRGLNPRTINCHIAQLRDFYQYVLKKSWDRYEVPTMHFDEHLPAVPSRKQVNTIIDSIDNPKHKAEIALLYSSGMRVSELCRLHCKDIYHSKNQIYISRSKNRSDRYAVLSEKAYQLLVDYIRNVYKSAKPDDWLFPGQKKGRSISEEAVRCVLRDQLELLGMADKGFNLHSLRHAFGLHLYESGADLMSIKEAMGHKSLSSTTIYLTLGVGNGRSVKSPYDE